MTGECQCPACAGQRLRVARAASESLLQWGNLIPHGTTFAVLMGCACTACVALYKAPPRHLRVIHPPDSVVHGSSNMIKNYACVCKICRP